MHYNLKVEIERVRSEYITQIEVASVGRAGRKRLVSPTFEQAIEDLTAAHDELLGHVADYHKASLPAEAASDPKPKGKGALAKPAHKSAQKILNQKMSALVTPKGPAKAKRAPKEAPRKFASE